MSASNSISFGIALPQVFYPGSVDMALVGSFVTRAEALGFESLWVQERIIGGVDSLEPVNLLFYVAALTQTAKLGTSVLIPSHSQSCNAGQGDNHPGPPQQQASYRWSRTWWSR